MSVKESASIFWFRRDLRLEDNHGLFKALNSSDALLPVFIFDKEILGKLSDKKDARVSFIHKTLEALNAELVKKGSSLFVVYDSSLKAFEKICTTFDVKQVFTNHDYEPQAIRRDAEIAAFLESKNIGFHLFKDQVIFEKAEVMKPDGLPYSIFTPYSRVWKQKFAAQPLQTFPSEKLPDHFLKTKAFEIPSLEEIGFKKNEIAIPTIVRDKNIIRNYEATRNFPAIDGTSKLSIHLRFGTVSVRALVKAANELNEQWLNELIWREFFMMILFHFPYVVHSSFKKKYDFIPWRNDEAEFKAWCNGTTGYPIVDAGMRELNKTGFMHNRVRMIVASFLIKHLLIDWRWGEAYFAEKLLDYELSSNNGNWQWAAGCGCDAAPYFRIFNPTAQMKKFDPEMIYIKKWVPEYKTGYLPEIVEHEFARKRVLEVFKKALG
ncbi:MAG: deoxyribodipyrimidine photo-lyase [Bacteroidia bacterium]